MKKLHTVILVDDDKIINFINEKTIKLVGFADKVEAFDNAGSAFDFIKDNCIKTCSAAEPAIIFLDLNMPIMDGWELLDEIKKIPDYSMTICKIYILSSSIDPADFAKAKEYEIVQDFISKPLTLEHLEKISNKVFSDVN